MRRLRTPIKTMQGEDAPPTKIAVSSAATPEILAYMAQHPIATYRFDARKELHSYESAPNNRRWTGGIHSYLNRMYRPDNYVKPARSKWKRSRAKVPSEHKKGSSKDTGLSTMTALENTVFGNGTRPPRTNKFANAILDWLDRRGFEIQVVEMPVIMLGINRTTRADLVTLTLDKKGYIVWEIKCGWPPGATSGKYKMKRQCLAGEPCHDINMFHLQAMYTKVGAEASGLKNVVCAKVLHVFEAEVLMELKTPPTQRKKPASKKGVKDTWEKEWGKPIIDAKRQMRCQKVVRVVAYDQPKWCRDHEVQVRQDIGIKD